MSILEDNFIGNPLKFLEKIKVEFENTFRPGIFEVMPGKSMDKSLDKILKELGLSWIKSQGVYGGLQTISEIIFWLIKLLILVNLEFLGKIQI